MAKLRELTKIFSICQVKSPKMSLAHWARLVLKPKNTKRASDVCLQLAFTQVCLRLAFTLFYLRLAFICCLGQYSIYLCHFVLFHWFHHFVVSGFSACHWVSGTSPTVLSSPGISDRMFFAHCNGNYLGHDD